MIQRTKRTRQRAGHITTKICTKCQQTKQIQFFKNKGGGKGYTKQCLACLGIGRPTTVTGEYMGLTGAFRFLESPPLRAPQAGAPFSVECVTDACAARVRRPGARLCGVCAGAMNGGE
jgi:hypothetical protein